MAEIKIPAVGESITEATISEWAKSDGEYVERDEIVLVLETDKASVEVVAENAGVLKVQVEEGETVEIGSVVGEIDESAEKPAGAATPAPEASAPTPSAAPPAPAAPATTNGSGTTGGATGPAARRVAAEAGINPASIAGTGPGGRVTKADAMQAAASPPPMAAPAAAPPAPTPEVGLPQPQFTGGQESTRETMTKLRQTIARRLVDAQHNAAILTTFNEIDMTNVMQLRAQYKEQFKEKYGVSLGFMGFFVKAAVEALKAFPRVNGAIDGNDIIFNNFVNMGIAVGTEKGLLVPVIRNAEFLSLADIEMSIRHYALKARDGKIAIDDLSGGTFTISNGGVYGSLMSTPILNPPQSGILGLHKIEERPMAINGEVKIRPMMYVALSYDHRIIDGAESVQFLVKIKEGIEDPSRLLLEI